MEGKYSYFGESMGTNFPGSCNLMDFASFSCAVENWWGNPSIFQVTKYTIGWESNGKKMLILWQKYEYQFPRISPIRYYFPVLWKTEGKTHAFPIWWSIPQDENLIVKRAHTMVKVWGPIFQAFPIRWVLLPFPSYGKSMRKLMHFPYDEVYHMMVI